MIIENKLNQILNTFYNEDTTHENYDAEPAIQADKDINKNFLSKRVTTYWFISINLKQII